MPCPNCKCGCAKERAKPDGWHGFNQLWRGGKHVASFYAHADGWYWCRWAAPDLASEYVGPFDSMEAAMKAAEEANA